MAKTRGEYRHLIEFWRLAGPHTDYCDTEEASERAYRAKAAIVPLTGQDLVNAQLVEKNITHRIEIPWPKSVRITTDYWILWPRTNEPTVRFNIRAVMNVESRNRELQLLCVMPTPVEVAA